MDYIEKGLEYFRMNFDSDRISSIAFHVLGSRNGKLDYGKDFDAMKRFLSDLPIPIEVYVNNSSCDNFTSEVIKFIRDADIDFLQSELDISRKTANRLQEHIMNIQSLSDLASYPDFCIERVHRIYDLGFLYFGQEIIA
jgi:hypothetical protein